MIHATPAEGITPQLMPDLATIISICPGVDIRVFMAEKVMIQFLSMDGMVMMLKI